MAALLLGSISTLADTSELQRRAFNAAFAEHGLDWTWDRDEYVELLTDSGGADRVTAYAAERGEDVDASAVHLTKSRLFQESLAGAGLEPRPGLLDSIAAAKAAGDKVALVTTTSPENVEHLLAALTPTLSATDFDLVLDATGVDSPKPDPAVYLAALEQLGESADDCVAVEDNLGGVAAATAAGIRCVAFPNANTAGHDFADAAGVTDHLSYDDLRGLATA